MENENLDEMTKKERRELEKTKKQAEYENRVRMKKIKGMIPWVVFVAVVIGGLYGLVSLSQKSNESRPGDVVASMGEEHIAPGAEGGTYNSNPPTSGPHSGPVPWGFSEEELADENVIHNLEHGGIWITFKDLDDQSVETLRNIARRNGLSVVVSPREANDSPVAVASWGRLLKLDSVDEAAITEYIQRNKNKSPEQLAR